MRAATRKQNSSNRRSAYQARLAGPQIDPVFQLKEPSNPVGVDVIGNRRSSERDCLAKHLLQRLVKPEQLFPFQPSRHPPRTNSGMKEALVSVNIPHTVQQPLIEKRRLDRKLAAAKKVGKRLRSDGERLGAWPGELRLAA